MSKSFVLAALLALLALPAATAQLEGTSTVTLSGLPANGLSTNETLAVVPFTVALQVSNLVCLGTGAEVTVEVTAETTAPNGTGNFSTTVEPALLRFSVPSGQSTSYSSGQGATLAVRPTDVVSETTNVTTTVSAAITQITGCSLVTDGDGEASRPVAISFERVRGSASDAGEELPGPALPLVLLALVALAVIVRRKA